MSKLKPCPFCGGKADTGHHKSRNKDDEYYLVMCVHCFARTVGETIEEAEDTWNTRADGWIPVSEKLPEKQQTVIVYSQYGTSLGWILWNEWMTIEGLCKPGATVTHWMPLPKPPQEVE